MGKLFGHSANEIVPQPDFNATQNENGGWKATQSFRIRKGDIDNGGVKAKFPSGGTLQSLDPDCDQYFAFLRLSHIISVQDIPGGWQEITPQFVGFSDATSTQDPPRPSSSSPIYSKRGVLVDAPLDEHPKWKDLTNDEKWALGLFLKGEMAANSTLTAVGTYEEYDYRKQFYTAIDNSGSSITFSSDAQEFIKRIAQGRTTYKLGSYTYHHRWQSNEGISAATMNDLGKISTPSGSPPTPGTGRDWLMIGADEEQNGSGEFMFDNMLTYLLSDEGGHDSFLQS